MKKLHSWWRRRTTLAVECDQLRKEIDSLYRRLRGAEERRQEAYTDRLRLLAILSRMFPSGTRNRAVCPTGSIAGWVFINLPTGQVSWPYGKTEAWMFEDLPEYRHLYDGHTDRVRAERLTSLFTLDPRLLSAVFGKESIPTPQRGN